MNKWLAKISDKKEKKITSIAVEFSVEGNYLLQAMRFEKRKKGISFECLPSFHEWKELKRQVKKEVPLAFTFYGRGVITRKIEKQENHVFSLRQVIPNASEEEFYYQCYEKENEMLVTVIRRSQADPVFEEIEKNGFLVGATFLGTIPAFLAGAIAGKSEIIAGNTKITIENNEPFQVIPTEEKQEEIIIDEKNIPGELLVSAGAGFSYFQSSPAWSELQNETVKRSREELMYKHLLNNVGLGALAVLLILLLFNQYIQGYYTERQLLLEEILANTASERTELKELKKDLEEKQQLVSSAGLFNSVQLSFYADRIAASVPDQVTLTELSVFPLSKKKMNDSEKAEFKNGEIVVQGNVRETSVLNRWVEIIQKNEWAAEVVIDQYQQGNENGTDSFTLHIKVA